MTHGRRTPLLAIWIAGGAATCGWLLIVWLFCWASQHDSGDGIDAPYPIAPTHAVLGGLVILSLLVAWSSGRSGFFRVVHLIPLAVAGGYAGTVLFFCVRALL